MRRQLHISLVSICTRQKANQHPHPLRREDLADPERLERRWRELEPLALPAQELYVGPPQRQLMPAVAAFRQAGLGTLDLRYLSAGFGLVPGQRPLVPYDCTFKGMGAAGLHAWARHLGVPAAMRAWLAQEADLRLVLLTDDYLRACGDLRQVSLGAPTLFVLSRRMLPRLPRHPLAQARVVERAHIRRCGCAAVALRAQLGAQMLRGLVGGSSCEEVLALGRCSPERG